jgi:DNA-binding response OmpR family regulator
LAREGYEVILAATKEEALQQIEFVRPDLVIMDIPRWHAEAACEVARVCHQTYNLPVILNTGCDRFTDDLLASNADAWVTKSSDLSELKGKIHQVLVELDMFRTKEVAHAQAG